MTPPRITQQVVFKGITSKVIVYSKIAPLEPFSGELTTHSSPLRRAFSLGPRDRRAPRYSHSMTDLLPPPAILKSPNWYGGPPDEAPLNLEPQHYAVQHVNDRTIITIIATGEIVYNGIGPAEIVAPA